MNKAIHINISCPKCNGSMSQWADWGNITTNPCPKCGYKPNAEELSNAFKGISTIIREKIDVPEYDDPC